MSTYKARKLNSLLVKRLLIPFSPYEKLLKYISIDSHLRMEIGTEGRANIYYRTCLALSLGAKSCRLEKKYLTEGMPESFDAKLKVAIDDPRLYFTTMKREIDKYLTTNNIDKQERASVQKIANFNQLATDKYLVVEAPHEINHKELIDKTENNCYDMIAVNQRANSVVIFKILNDINNLNHHVHIEKFERNFRKNENRNTLAKLLETDIRNIVEDKNQLGLLNNCTVSDELRLTSAFVDFKFIYIYDNNIDHKWQIFEYNRLLEANNVPSYYDTIFVDIDEIPKLQ